MACYRFCLFMMGKEPLEILHGVHLISCACVLCDRVLFVVCCVRDLCYACVVCVV
jgi:hypothetical protein